MRYGSNLTAGDLIEMLQDLDPDTEIRLMSQPSWPFEYSLATDLYIPERVPSCPTCGADLVGRDHDEGCTQDQDENPVDTFEPEGSPEKVAYLVEGTQLAYGTKAAWG